MWVCLPIGCINLNKQFICKQTYQFIMVILQSSPKVVGTETSLCIYSERFAGDVIVSADLGAGGHVQVGAGPPEALAGCHISIGMAEIHISLNFVQIVNQLP